MKVLLIVGYVLSILVNIHLCRLVLKRQPPKKEELSKKEITMVKQIVNMMNFDGLDDVNED